MSSNTLTLDLIERGEYVLTVFDKDIADLSAKAYRYTLNGIECLACNAPAKYASELGNVLAKKATFAAIYSFDGQRKEWQYSLRSVGDFSVKDIAALFGGGGHKNAAGFSTKELIL
jgi:nanoRNase/pAp phosphatase (c-di-AMP/oligoRNAs hydrolase)